MNDRVIALVLVATVFATAFLNPVSSNQRTVEESSTGLEHYFGPPPGPQTRELDRQGFDYVEYNLNEQGFRDTEDYGVEKEDGTYRIAFFGDSVLTGGFVNDSKVWTEVLERRLNRDLECGHDFSVMNMGINAHDTPYTAEYYVRNGSRYETNLDVFVFQNNDVYEVGEIFRATIERHKQEYRRENGELPEHPSPEHSQLISKASQEARKKVSSLNRTDLFQRQVHRPVGRIAREADDKNSTAILTLTVDSDVNAEYREAARENGLLFGSINEVGTELDYDGLWAQYAFPEQKEPHPDESGNRLIADYVYIHLVANDLVDCDYYDAFE